MMNRASEACQQGKEEAGGLMQQVTKKKKTKEKLMYSQRDAIYEMVINIFAVLLQTGEQVKQMAQGAADAVKNAVGMDGSTTTSTTRTTTTKP